MTAICNWQYVGWLDLYGTLLGASPQEARYFLMNRWSFHQATLWLCVLSMSPWDLLNVTLVERPSVLYFTRSAQQTDHLDVTLVEHTPDLVSNFSLPRYILAIACYMTQQKPEMPSGVDQQPSPGPSYMGSSPASFDYVEEQFGGGRRYEAPPAELTPSRLRTRLKATVAGPSVLSRTPLPRRQAYQKYLYTTFSFPLVHSHHVVQDGASTSTSDTSSLTLNVAYSRHNSPFPPLQGPAQLQDLFYGPMDQQSPWMQQNPSGDFGMMQPDTFTAGLLGDQALGMGWSGRQVAGGLQPSCDQRQDASHVSRMFAGSSRPTVFGIDAELTIHPASCTICTRLKIMPILFQPTKHHPANTTQGWWRDPSPKLDLGHYSPATTYRVRFPERDHLQEELGRCEKEKSEGSGTPSATLRRKCYEKFKDTFPDTYQDILSKHEEVALLSSSPPNYCPARTSIPKTLSECDEHHLDLKQPLYYVVKWLMKTVRFGHSYNTPGAGGFWEMRCRASDDMIIGHLKAHVYNTTSLSAKPGTIAIKNRHRPLPHDIDQASDVVEGGREDNLKFVKQEITRQAAKFGCKIHGGKIFPWKLMPAALVEANLSIQGYPGTQVPISR
ncbi:hypothetical protein DFJ58DRAFT_843460 [Suillus subalutaceus]|uniref:uncharacterized protein n=1 Tax=Suillus subalutaceus TaxID=48586 RepID=UPI001B87602F|nr:uncharacterized protein DFJ58DRAFT_843460 [Suillus subalutaceus]KAG1846377.1 hypothetical protein DFJ58DRAFT_843460 [Suillus subalutaceus]